MDKLSILAVAPYDGLNELILQVAGRRADISVTTVVGDLNAGLEAARRAASMDEYDIILSRGGTADLLSRYMDLPTLDIAISLGDILQAIKLAQNYNAKFAIVGFPSIAHRAQLICTLLGYDIDVYTVTDEKTIPEMMDKIKSDGCMLLIGDVVTTTVARLNGINAILITSNAESIETAFDQALKLSGSYKKMRLGNQLLRQVIEGSPCQTMVYLKSGELLYSTLSEENKQAGVAAYAERALGSLWSRETSSVEKIIGGRYVSITSKVELVNSRQILILYISDKPVPPAFGDGSVAVTNRSDTMYERYNRYYGFSGAMRDTNQAIEKYARLSTPLVLLGEQGTGKDSVAAYVYSIGPYADNPLYTVDCQLINDKQLMALLTRPDSILNEMYITLYMKNILSLSPVRREQFLQFVEHSSLAKRMRIICSVVVKDDEQKDETQTVYMNIASRLGAVTLSLAPLRERKSDISSIATLYLSQLNATLGKQLAGFDPQALEMLTNFPWPFNLDQFHRVLRELASLTESFFISAEDTRAVLKGESSQFGPSSDVGLNLDQTLDDITYDVVRMVLKREGNNQKRAAERLGIGRSTVWRILKSRE